MNCPIHVAVPMVLVTPPGPRRRYKSREGDGVILVSGGEEIVKREVYLHCPVAGCYRVAEQPKALEAPRKPCPKCGKPTDAPTTRQSIYDYRCMNCIRRSNEKKLRLRQKKILAAQMGA